MAKDFRKWARRQRRREMRQARLARCLCYHAFVKAHVQNARYYHDFVMSERQ